jgi:hypothetical protein
MAAASGRLIFINNANLFTATTRAIPQLVF